MGEESSKTGIIAAVVAVVLLPLVLLFSIPLVLMNQDGTPCDPTATPQSSSSSSGLPMVVAGDVVFPLPEGSWVKTSDRAYRISPTQGIGEWHAGTDYSAALGTPVMAVADGRVVSAGWNTFGYGNLIIVEHLFDGQMVQTAYAHLVDGGILVSVGQVVKAGETIGLVGSTGNSTGPHLHLEIRPNGAVNEGTLDSVQWLAANGVTNVQPSQIPADATAVLASGGLPPCSAIAGDTITPGASGSAIVDAAEAQIGKPYVWASAGPDSFDCSGLVKYALATQGTSLPHLADDQARMGQEVYTGACASLPMNQMEPGDVVAFAGDHRVYQHIGIYAGSGQMIHAPYPGSTVKYETIPGYWTPQTCTVRRF